MRSLVSSNHPDVLLLSEIKILSLSKFSRLISSLQFSLYEFVPAIGKSRGLALCWKSSVNLQLIVSNANLINVLVMDGAQ